MKYNLHTGIKTIIESKGKDVLRSILLANILADYGAFEDYPATKVVLKDFLSHGYGNKILEQSSDEYISLKFAIDSAKKEFEKHTKYKKEITNYVIDSIAYGLGIVSNVVEPLSTGYDPYASESDGILERLPDMLSKLKKDYSEALEDLLTKPDDLIWDAPAYYSASSENKLYLLEGKIAVITNFLGQSNQEWCKKQKSSILQNYKNRKLGAVKELLDSRKATYQNLINKAFNAPNKIGNGKLICFDNSKHDSIEKLESTIVALYKELGQTYDKWCENQKAVLINSTLVQNKNDYLELLKKALIIPNNRIISRSAYFDNSFSLDIKDKEQLITALYGEMGSSDGNWCEDQKNNILKPYVVSRAKQLGQIIFKVILPIIILLFGGSQYLSYKSSSAAIERYESSIEKGDNYMAQGNYGNAIRAYLAAGNSYNGDFYKSSYISGSIDKADECFDNLKVAVEQQMQEKEYKLIHNELKSLPQNYIEVNTSKKEWVEQTKSNLKTAVDSEVETLISLISQNNGQLNDEGMKFLNELLSISPDNYWFKLIKNKKQ